LPLINIDWLMRTDRGRVPHNLCDTFAAGIQADLLFFSPSEDRPNACALSPEPIFFQICDVGLDSSLVLAESEGMWTAERQAAGIVGEAVEQVLPRILAISTMHSHLVQTLVERLAKTKR
jgi:hypothetical protein